MISSGGSPEHSRAGAMPAHRGAGFQKTAHRVDNGRLRRIIHVTEVAIELNQAFLVIKQATRAPVEVKQLALDLETRTVIESGHHIRERQGASLARKAAADGAYLRGR